MTKGSYLYVYCAVRGAVSARALKRLPSLPEASPPRAVPLDKNVSLIATDVPANIYSAKSIESRLGDLTWVAACGAAHHAVVDNISSKYVVVPFRLFTLFSSESRALAIMSRRKRAIARMLDRVRGRAEWVLRIQAPDASRASDGSSRAAKGAPTGTSFLQAKAEARRAAAERAERVQRQSVEVFEALSAMAEEANARPVAAGANLMLDAAFLVPVRETAAFKRRLARAARGLLDEGCAVSLTGPWPAYSFVSLK